MTRIITVRQFRDTLQIQKAGGSVTPAFPLHSEIEEFLLDPIRVPGQADDCLYEDMQKKDPRPASIMRFEEPVDWIKEKDIQMRSKVRRTDSEALFDPGSIGDPGKRPAFGLQ